jgi:biopolymer transport protein TolQ
LTLSFCGAFLWQSSILDLVTKTKPLPAAVLGILLIFSVLSWAIIWAKWNAFRRARRSSAKFLRAFRKATGMEAVAVASEQFRPSPLVSLFEFGYEELARQVKLHGSVTNKLALERTLQIGISEELGGLERYLNWLATVASVSPFIGLFGTVWGIIDAFEGLGMAGSASLRYVAPGIAEALVATAMGLAAAIPAAIFYNHFGYVLRELGARMDDFSLEFMNLAERGFEE